ncbi:hypothetical protein GCM10010168_86260 [Actinoplanes ianthinogenes]|uniref:Uncharacterized protein n=1 Tax=Actinoplanes ianthinogenes TaxID=122358 RepID=A0ABN6CK27_9ACTN|nr:hypothetical protein [Actinoplanes ianthinogenes]BCJ45357.1 hypothetical protein Aiant_60140 [Actinoplanes ianthinogenes]GGR53989.1 hypothetical protein GCM10010168_86260 [Actinoplanes ianthinogenes]
MTISDERRAFFLGLPPEDLDLLAGLMRRELDKIPDRIARLRNDEEQIVEWLTEFAPSLLPAPPVEPEAQPSGQATGSADLLDRARAHLVQCGPCDFGMPGACNCPPGDPRALIDDLVNEVTRLRAALVDEQAAHAKTISNFEEFADSAREVEITDQVVAAVCAEVDYFGFDLGEGNARTVARAVLEAAGFTVADGQSEVKSTGQATDSLCRCTWLGVGTPEHERSAFCPPEVTR